MANTYKTIKLIIKHILGRDLYLRPTRRILTRFYGSGYGGWSLPENVVNKDSVVYSFGIGEDASFDLALIEEVGCSVHGFDPTPKSLSWIASNIQESRFLIYPWALGAQDGMMELWLPENPDHVSASCRQSDKMSGESFMAICKKLRSIMDSLGHTKIDVLKMDIEGAEYEVIQAMIADSTIDVVNYLLIEYHHWMPSFKNDDTLHSIEALTCHGFDVLWVSDSGHELLFGR